MEILMIYITYPTMEEAKKIVHNLLEKKLISCANFFPVKSSFWWEGEIDNSEEIVSICKTKKENWEKVKSEVKKLHSYQTPCILKINAEANEEFFDWVNSEVK